VLIAVIVNEPQQAALIEATRGADLIAPPSMHRGINHAFSTMLQRTLQAITTYQQIPLRLVGVELAESLQLAAELNIYAYDAYLLRCAMRYSVPLLTLDQQLSRLAG